MSGENFSSAFDQGISFFDNSATSQAPIGYFTEQKEPQNIEASKRKERLVGLIQEIPKPIIGLSTLQNELIGVATRSDALVEINNVEPQTITEAADYFISRQKKSVKYRTEILKVSSRVTEYLKREKIDADVTVDLLTDPEYSNWVEPKIQILVKNEQLKKTYDVFDKLLEFSFSGISKKTLQRLSVTIDSRQW